MNFVLGDPAIMEAMHATRKHDGQPSRHEPIVAEFLLK
jgi:hypothetical protein